MFEYVRVNLLKVSVEPIGNYLSEAVTVIAKISGDISGSKGIYFKIDSIRLNISGEEVTYEGYYEGVFPSEALSKGYLYLAYSLEDEIKPIFIDPFIYESIDKIKLDEVVLDYIEDGLSGITSYEMDFLDEDLTDEELIEVEKELDLELKDRLLTEVYLESYEFYEVKDTEELITGPMFIDFIEEDSLDEDEECYYYYEPLVYKVNQEELIVISEDGLQGKYASLFLMNDDFIVERKEDLSFNKITDYFKNNDYSVRSIAIGSQIEKELRMIAENRL